MPLHREIELLIPEMQKIVLVLLKRLDELKLPYYVNETLRDLAVQQSYYSQGRKPLQEVNDLRQKAGLRLISAPENKNIITWTLNSKHLEGKAIDIVGLVNKQPSWNMNDSFWKTIADEAVKLGLQAGYYWTPPDKPHLQLP
jgi:hypothetical protein